MRQNYVANPGPIQAAGHCLYQLDNNHPQGNLWGGWLSVHNGHDPVHLERAVKLFLAAEDMLAALEMAKNGMEWQRDNRPMHWDQSDDEALAQVEAAITKATL